MEKSLFLELKKTGVDEETAAHVQAALNGEHYATKNDLLAMQSLLYQQQEKMINGFANIKTEIADVRTEIGGMHRQYWITFGGLITTIFSVFAVNWYYHL